MVDTCAVKKCKLPLEIIYLGKPVCGKHWDKLSGDRKKLRAALGVGPKDDSSSVPIAELSQMRSWNLTPVAPPAGGGGCASGAPGKPLKSTREAHNGSNPVRPRNPRSKGNKARVPRVPSDECGLDDQIQQQVPDLHERSSSMQDLQRQTSAGPEEGD